MMMADDLAPLADAQLQELTGARAKWTLVRDGKAIRTDLHFATFVDAWGFMNEIALCAEKCDHHPEWSNVYSSVTIELTTHDADGLTQRDFALAGDIDRALALRAFTPASLA